MSQYVVAIFELVRGRRRLFPDQNATSTSRGELLSSELTPRLACPGFQGHARCERWFCIADTAREVNFCLSRGSRMESANTERDSRSLLNVAPPRRISAQQRCLPCCHQDLPFNQRARILAKYFARDPAFDGSIGRVFFQQVDIRQQFMRPRNVLSCEHSLGFSQSDNGRGSRPAQVPCCQPVIRAFELQPYIEAPPQPVACCRIQNPFTLRQVAPRKFRSPSAV